MVDKYVLAVKCLKRGAADVAAKTWLFTELICHPPDASVCAVVEEELEKVCPAYPKTMDDVRAWVGSVDTLDNVVSALKVVNMLEMDAKPFLEKLEKRKKDVTLKQWEHVVELWPELKAVAKSSFPRGDAFQ